MFVCVCVCYIFGLTTNSQKQKEELERGNSSSTLCVLKEYTQIVRRWTLVRFGFVFSRFWMLLVHVCLQHVRPFESLGTFFAIVSRAPKVLLVFDCKVEHNSCPLICFIFARLLIDKASVQL